MSETPDDQHPHRGHGRDYAAAIYGSIVATALIGALAEAHVSSRDITLSVLATMVVFWIAHTWAAVAGERIHMRHRLSWHRVRALADEEWPMVEAGFAPLAALLLGWLGLVADGTAAKIAVAFGVIQLLAWGFFLGHRVYRTWHGALLAGLGNGVLGLVLVLLEMAVLH
jgi:hypothetical protein